MHRRRNTAFGFSYIIFMTFFVKHLIASGGYSRSSAGTLFMTMGWASLCGGFIWGAISDRIGRKRTLVTVYLIQPQHFAQPLLLRGSPLQPCCTA